LAFTYDFTASLKATVSKLYTRDWQRYEILLRKVEQIASGDWQAIDHFKNLRHGLSDRKRVHIDKSFVLTFSVDRKNNHILFLEFDHHDNIYKR